eukprot:TRINITY_DN10270_c0_g1_i1.p1 TRINITY_DN10270_c0_g1~~TRINITY_DN10270_c0_g1_i1.p1  ORF type:complete len:438 (+),score=83.25 TRINITY_DN10270_c0_g1_i1:34-1347(+)
MPGLKNGYTAVFEKAMEEVLQATGVPGVSVYARRGNDVFSCGKGEHSDLSKKYRMHSMTKVITSTAAIMTTETHKDFLLTDPVSKYIPSFDREWDLILEGTEEKVSFKGFSKGPAEVSFKREKSKTKMLVSHLMAECSGIGYDFWTESGVCGENYSAAAAIRQAVHPEVFNSSCIIGSHLTLAEYCDKIAEAGVLVCEPGNFSYGLGALVVGRVLEVVHGKPFSQILSELIFKPLGMNASFFISSPDEMHALYGVASDKTVVKAEATIADCGSVAAYTNHTDHALGPKKLESGDTGLVMPIAEYAKFCEFVLSKGLAADGTRVMDEKGIYMLCHGDPHGCSMDSRMGNTLFGFGYPAAMTFGWAKTDPKADPEKLGGHDFPVCNYWSGYAGNQVRVYPTEDSYIIVGMQVMDHHYTRTYQDTVRLPLVEKFISLWEK